MLYFVGQTPKRIKVKRRLSGRLFAFRPLATALLVLPIGQLSH